jgi:hypothetical protein
MPVGKPLVSSGRMVAGATADAVVRAVGDQGADGDRQGGDLGPVKGQADECRHQSQRNPTAD